MEDESKYKVEEDWEYFIDDWKKGIYQKMPKMNLEFWYGNEEEMGMKEKLEREEVERKNRGEG